MSDPERTTTVLAPTQQAPAAARALVRQFLGAAVDGQAEVVTVLTSELVTNAVRHGRGDVHLEIARQDHVIRVEVSDDDPCLPLPSPEPDPDAESGRGLRIVAALASEWGAEPRESGIGKTVWFQLRAD